MLHNQTITTPEQAKAYLKELYDNDLMFHLDDDPSDIGVFSDDECLLVVQRVREVKEQLKDPFEYIVDELNY